MSGIVQNNILRSSGTVAVSAAGLNWSDTIITGSTATVEAGNGYWINTTSNTCTITLPSSAESGDQIVLIDYARTWGTNKIIIDSNGLNYQGNDDTYTVEYNTDGQSVNIVYSDATKGWIPLEDDVTALEPTAPPTQKAIFAFGIGISNTNISNLVNSSGVIASDTTGVGTARYAIAATTYGGDKAIFGFGLDGPTGITNLVSNSGVVAADTAGVGTARSGVAASTYGSSGQALFGYGTTGSVVSVTNLISSSGVVASDTTGVGTARRGLAAASYGTDKVIFGYGNTGSNVSMTNLANNLGVVAADVSGVGTARQKLGAVSYGSSGQALFAYGYTGSYVSLKNLVNNSGVVASDVTGVGTARAGIAASNYGGDKGIFAYGEGGSNVSMSNLVNSSGVVAADVTGVGTARSELGAAGYSYSA
jgi:hypothetical protein